MAILFASYKSFKNRAAIFILLLFLQIGISQENVLDSLKLNLQRIENASNFDKKDTLKMLTVYIIFQIRHTN